MSDIALLDEETLREQLKARNVMKKEMPIFYGSLLVGFVSFILFDKNSGWGFIAFLSFLVVFRTIMVWYQWNFLMRFNLKCPYCKKPLAERTSLLRSPNHDCPHCGQRALAPIKQLVEFEKSENR